MKAIVKFRFYGFYHRRQFSFVKNLLKIVNKYKRISLLHFVLSCHPPLFLCSTIEWKIIDSIEQCFVVCGLTVQSGIHCYIAYRTKEWITFSAKLVIMKNKIRYNGLKILEILNTRNDSFEKKIIMFLLK